MHPLRRRLLSLALWPCALATSLPAPAQDTPLENASWIWAAGEPGAAPAPTCFFRSALRLDAPPARAELFVTADNVYELCARPTPLYKTIPLLDGGERRSGSVPAASPPSAPTPDGGTATTNWLPPLVHVDHEAADEVQGLVVEQRRDRRRDDRDRLLPSCRCPPQVTLTEMQDPALHVGRAGSAMRPPLAQTSPPPPPPGESAAS